MSKIADQLNELLKMKKDLVTNLNAKGVAASDNETLETLVPKVLAIVQGGSGDVTLGPKVITQDGDYYPYQDELDGYSSVSVQVLGDNNVMAKYEDVVGTVRYLNITSFGDLPTYAWYNTNKFHTITLKNCENIGASAFYGCGSLQEVITNTTIKSLGIYSFFNCTNLESTLVLDDTITEIPNNCFQNCKKVKLNLPKNLTKIGSSGLNQCESLIATELPQTLNDVEGYGLYRCTNLTASIMPVISTMGNYAFAYSGVTFKEIPKGSVLAQYAFAYCDGLTNLTISNDGAIPNYCFRYCDNLSSVEIDGEITSVGSYAFGNCSKLKTFTIHRATPPTLQSNTFSLTTLDTIYVPASALETYKSATNWSRYADIMAGIEGE